MAFHEYKKAEQLYGALLRRAYMGDMDSYNQLDAAEAKLKTLRAALHKSRAALKK